MTRKERFAGIVGWFEQNVPHAGSELVFKSPYELLVAVILSAQCTDKRVNLVTPPLFERFPTPEDLASATFDEVYPFVKSVSYPNAKARHLIAMARMLVSEYGSVVPSDIDALRRMPGVGRKTANVVVSNAFHIPAIAVDTHVFRVSNRIGLAEAKTVEKTEEQLMAHIPEKDWTDAHHWIIFHGRRVCAAQRPKCAECALNQVCDFYTRKDE